MKEFKSIHILNGKLKKFVTDLTSRLDAESWSLRINKDERYEEGSRRTPSSIARAIRDTDASIRGQE